MTAPPAALCQDRGSILALPMLFHHHLAMLERVTQTHPTHLHLGFGLIQLSEKRKW